MAAFLSTPGGNASMRWFASVDLSATTVRCPGALACNGGAPTARHRYNLQVNQRASDDAAKAYKLTFETKTNVHENCRACEQKRRPQCLQALFQQPSQPARRAAYGFDLLHNTENVNVVSSRKTKQQQRDESAASLEPLRALPAPRSLPSRHQGNRKLQQQG